MTGILLQNIYVLWITFEPYIYKAGVFGLQKTICRVLQGSAHGRNMLRTRFLFSTSTLCFAANNNHLLKNSFVFVTKSGLTSHCLVMEINTSRISEFLVQNCNNLHCHLPKRIESVQNIRISSRSII